MNITKRIDELCELHKISKYQLSQLTGISQSVFSKMARDQTSLSLYNITRVCDAFGISLAQFFSDSDEYPDLTQNQRRLLHYWCSLSKSKQNFVLEMMEKLIDLDLKND